MQSLIETQLHRIKARGVGASAEINPFWLKLLAAIDDLLKATPHPSNAQIQAVMGYASLPLPDGVTNRSVLDARGILDAMERHTTDGLSKGDAGHAAQLYFLKHRNLLRPYLAWADAAGLLSDLNLGRLWWYAERLQERLAALDRVAPQVFLEVGSGSGRLAMNLYQRGLVRHYVMVDLPEMLINAMITVAESAPGADMRLGETPNFSISRPTFWFLETAAIENVPSGGVDVAVNINSMMEMDETVRDDYLAQMDRTLRSGGLLYNVNRMQRTMTRRNGETFESNPLLYPYPPTARVLEWEPDACQESTRAKTMRAHPSFTISRMHLKA